MKLKIFFAVSVLSWSAWAGPPVNKPSCAEGISVRSVRNGAGIVFDDRCETAYVLPPASGVVELSAAAPSVSADECAELNALEEIRAALAEKVRERMSARGKPQSPGSTIGGGGGTIGGGSPGGLEEQESPEPQASSEEINALILDLGTLRTATEYYSKIEGMVAKLTYTLDHDGLVSAYAKANPHLKNVVRLNPETAYLSWAGKDELDTAQKEVLDYTVPGIVRFPDEGELSSGEVPENAVYFGTNLSGKVRLTARGACRFMARDGSFPETIKASQLEKHLTANLTYLYGLNVKRKYTATYNYKTLFEHMEKSSTQGGFLSSKTIHEVLVRNEGGSWFNFESESNDTRYPNEVLAQQIKGELISRVLAQVAEARVPGSSEIPKTIEPGKKGVDVAAEGLKKCPYTYCQVAGYVLDFVGATFGRSTAISHFLSTVGVEGSERVEESKTLRFIGTSSFKDRL